MTKNIYEVLTEVSKAKTVKKRIKILREHDTFELRTILRGALDPNIKFNLPEGNPPFNADVGAEGLNPSGISQQIRLFKYFIKGGEGDNLPLMKRETMFIGMLESVHKTEAMVLIGMKDKKLKFRNLTTKLVNDAFPNLISFKEDSTVDGQENSSKEG